MDLSTSEVNEGNLLNADQLRDSPQFLSGQFGVRLCTAESLVSLLFNVMAYLSPVVRAVVSGSAVSGCSVCRRQRGRSQAKPIYSMNLYSAHTRKTKHRTGKPSVACTANRADAEQPVSQSRQGAIISTRSRLGLRSFPLCSHGSVLTFDYLLKSADQATDVAIREITLLSIHKVCSVFEALADVDVFCG